MTNNYILTWMNQSECERRNFKDVDGFYAEMPISTIEEGFKIVNNLIKIFDLKAETSHVDLGQYPETIHYFWVKDEDKDILLFSIKTKNYKI